MNHVTLLTPEGKLEKIVTDSHGAANAPMCDVRLGPEIEPVVARAAELLGDSEVTDLLQRAYRPGRPWAAHLPSSLPGCSRESGVVLLDASDPELHEIAQPVYRAAVVGRKRSTTRCLPAAGNCALPVTTSR